MSKQASCRITVLPNFTSLPIQFRRPQANAQLMPMGDSLAMTGSAVRCLPIPLNPPSKLLHPLVRSRGPRGLPTPNVAAGHGSRCGVPSHAVLTGCQNTLPTAKTRCGRVEQQLVGCSVACRALHKRTAGGSPKLQVEVPRRTNFWVGGEDVSTQVRTCIV